MAAHNSSPRSALAALTATEKSAVLDELLAIRPDLRQLAETHAARLLSNDDRYAVADDIEHTLMNVDFTALSGRAGYQPGQGYVHPVDAASETLDEELEPFRHDLERRAALGMEAAAVELAVGVLLGLYACRDAGGETLLAYSPDYASERAADVLEQCRRLGVDVPVAEFSELVSEWSGIMGRHGRRA